jgi:hypothetical protein
MRARRRDHHPRRPNDAAGAPAAAERPREGGPRSGRTRRKRGGSGGGSSGSADRAAAGPADGRPDAKKSSDGSGGNGQTATQGAGGGGGRNPSRNRRKDRNRRPKVDPLSFWGDAAVLPSSESDVRITDDPGAVSRSLGTPPLPGQEIVAPHYFAAVYDRAVMTAGALAAAGGLIDTETLSEELGD